MAPDPLRIVIASTGRSGTTWLQLMLSFLLDARPRGVRNWDSRTGRFTWDEPGRMRTLLLRRLKPIGYETWDDLWRSLPDRAILHAHWPFDPAIVRELDANGCRIVTVARHPLDVLISHLRWVNEQGHPNPILSSLRGHTPLSPAFLEFAAGPHAVNLLAISAGWWDQPAVARLRYEDMKTDPEGQLQNLLDRLGLEPAREVADAVRLTELSRLRGGRFSLGRTAARDVLAGAFGLWATLGAPGWSGAEVRRHRLRQHFWLGEAEGWKKFLPGEQAQTIAAAHSELFEQLGYTCQPDPSLNTEQAASNWQRLR